MQNSSPEENKSREVTLYTFGAISLFVEAVHEQYGNQHKPLRLYFRLIQHTALNNMPGIKRHIQAFKDFCASNRDAIQKKDYKALTDPYLKYSENVYINLYHIFNIADAENRTIMWQHILKISAYVDPEGNARDVLEKMIRPPSSENISTNLANPLNLIQGLLNGGGSGELGNMMSSLMQGLNTENGEPPDIANMFQNVQSALGSEDIPPEMQNMFSMLTGMLGNLSSQLRENSSSNTIENEKNSDTSAKEE